MHRKKVIYNNQQWLNSKRFLIFSCPMKTVLIRDNKVWLIKESCYFRIPLSCAERNIGFYVSNWEERIKGGIGFVTIDSIRWLHDPVSISRFTTIDLAISIRWWIINVRWGYTQLLKDHWTMVSKQLILYCVSKWDCNGFNL